jgi:hypothetical protein
MNMLRTTLFTALLAAANAQTVPPNAMMPPLSADLEIERIIRSIDGNTITQKASGRFYRDNEHRTRMEWDKQVMIFDPVSQKTISLNLQKRTARVTSLAGKPTDRRGGASIDDETAAGAEIGVRVIEGYEARGKEFTTLVPISQQIGNTRPIRRTTRLWYSTQLTIPLLTTVDDPFTGQVSTAYRNLRVGANPDQQLFAVPPGFSIVNSAWEPPGNAPSTVLNPHFPQQ